jgi:hypothetical protein
MQYVKQLTDLFPVNFFKPPKYHGFVQFEIDFTQVHFLSVRRTDALVLERMFRFCVDMATAVGIDDSSRHSPLVLVRRGT